MSAPSEQNSEQHAPERKTPEQPSQSLAPGPSAAQLPPVDRSSRRWIKKRLDQLDPVRDYAEIIKLTSVYQMSDFVMKWSFTLTMPRFNLGPSGAAISRGGKGKLFTDVDRRYDDTGFHGIAWAEYGPESPQAQRSLDIVNALHAKWQKEYPEEFDDPDLWAYVIAFQVCGFSLLFGDRLGFPPPSEKEQIARVIYGKKLAERFVYIDGRPLSEVITPYETYDEWVAFAREYEARPFEYCQGTTDCLNQVLDSFGKKVALPAFFARGLVKSFWHDGMFTYTGIKPPSRAMRWTARNCMKALMALGALQPDAKESYPERVRRLAAESGKPLNPIVKAVEGSAKASGGGCPMGFSA